MARGPDYVEGWPAVAWVAGVGGALLLGAVILWAYSRAFTDKAPVVEGYRTEPADGARRRESLRALAILLVALCVATQLLYVNLYIELIRWLLGSREQPRVFIQLFFWVALIDTTCLGAALYTGLRR